MNINDILLAQNIKRWTIVSTTQDQSLAEHLFNVTMIARRIAAEAGIPDERIIKYALDHDLDEVMTGDIPSPAKERMLIPDDYKGKSRELCDCGEAIVVKAADLIDAYLFIKHNHHDRHGATVYKSMQGKLDAFLLSLAIDYPTINEAVENTLSMLEFGQYDVEQRGRNDE